MANDLIIVGAGGTSREIVDAVEAINAESRTWNFLGFLDDNTALKAGSISGYPVLGRIDDIAKFPNASIVIGIGNDRHRLIRRDIAARLSVERHRFATLIHPKACVSTRATLGYGNVILAFSFVSCDVTTGDHVLANASVVISHDVTVGSYASISPDTSISGGVKIGEGAFMGHGARIYPGVEIGEGALIGIGTVVTTSVPPGVTVFGNPGRILKISS